MKTKVRKTKIVVRDPEYRDEGVIVFKDGRYVLVPRVTVPIGIVRKPYNDS